MKILLTGATGYIGKRLLPVLLDKGHVVVCCVRDKQRFDTSKYSQDQLEVVELDFLKPDTLNAIPKDIDAAYYLIHSMSAAGDDFEELEKKSAQNFRDRLRQTDVQQVIYLGGIVNSKELSKHLRSRKQVEDILASPSYALTTLRAGIIVGSGSASFEIIRDLVEKLPVMIAPKWLNTRTQPIAIRNVIEFLSGVLGREETYNKTYDIGGPQVLTYREMLLKFAEVRNLKRTIITVPVMTPRLSSYWLYFVTSTSYQLAVNLVNSMKVEVVCDENNLDKLLEIALIPYEKAIRMAFDKVEQQEVLSSWTDAQSSNLLAEGISNLIEVPTYGCFKDERSRHVEDEQHILDRVWSIGGKTGWYYGNWLWEVRGFLDKLVGGVGLRRGRKSNTEITAGDSLDFWRVLYADKEEKRLLLYAEMKLPGEAWLEFRIAGNTLYQVATFRPLGVWGRLYWYALLPFHAFIFKGMIDKITEKPESTT
ncbi:SDR family oxidoreductase [Halalkalibaculum sp. DA384]|uniref:SDR family oxidoreductase n=1 Tax=Halalkalibaculum sp. DA384 TaxID=3373606 RepID=UPI0037544912